MLLPDKVKIPAGTPSSFFVIPIDVALPFVMLPEYEVDVPLTPEVNTIFPVCDDEMLPLPAKEPTASENPFISKLPGPVIIRAFVVAIE